MPSFIGGIPVDNISLAQLPTEQVACIRNFIDQKKQEDKYLPYCANPILREDIFVLLDQCCTVVYFPVDDQTNNGFHVRYPEGDIVYINTNQTKEKQIFTAAHELGHIWGLEDYIQEQITENENYRPEEIPKLESALLDQRGNTVLMAVASNMEAVQQAVE